jgi:hypothetical protein
MNKRRLGEAVLHAGGFATEEAAARLINAEPWEPMPGMVKRQCPECRYFFAAPVGSRELRCQDCIEKPPRGRRRPA